MHAAPFRGRELRTLATGEEHAVAIGTSDVRCLDVELSPRWTSAAGRCSISSAVSVVYARRRRVAHAVV
jgi:hypothetical protein